MNRDLLKQHIKKYMADARRDPKKFEQDLSERNGITAHYRQFSRDRILEMSPDEIYDYLSRLWAMRIWGNKHYVVDKVLEDNGLDSFKRSLADLVWGGDIAARWNAFRTNVKGMGPAMISEILCRTHPADFMVWNRRAYVGLNYLQVKDLPRYDYQLTGDVYRHLCQVCKDIATEFKKAGSADTTLLTVDYFIWEQLQIEDSNPPVTPPQRTNKASEESKFIHKDIQEKLRDIGQWLGFTAKIEQKVSQGAVVDTIWEATIGNMGRVIYVFEVQTRGSIDSLILNLLKSLNNSAVQGVVAVSDQEQLEKIKAEANDVKELRDKLKYWDYEAILKIHEGLEFVNASINELGLVPEGF